MAVVRIPVVCPVCGREEVQSFEVAALAAALLQAAQIRLGSACHRAAWNASALEVEQMRQYLGVITPRAD